MRMRALRRRAHASGGARVVLPLVSYLTPLPLKRALRRRLGQAP